MDTPKLECWSTTMTTPTLSLETSPTNSSFLCMLIFLWFVLIHCSRPKEKLHKYSRYPSTRMIHFTDEMGGSIETVFFHSCRLSLPQVTYSDHLVYRFEEDAQASCCSIFWVSAHSLLFSVLIVRLVFWKRIFLTLSSFYCTMFVFSEFMYSCLDRLYLFSLSTFMFSLPFV